MSSPLRETFRKEENMGGISEEEMDEQISSHPRFSKHKNSIVGDTRILQTRRRHKSPSAERRADFILEEEEGHSEDDDDDSLKRVSPSLPAQLFSGGGNSDDSEVSDSLSLPSTRSKSVRFKVPECEEIPEEHAPPSTLSDSNDLPLPKVKVITGVMKHTMSKLLEREARLDSLDMILRRELKWRQLRMKLALGVLGLVGIFLFLFPTLRKLIGRSPKQT